MANTTNTVAYTAYVSTPNRTASTDFDSLEEARSWIAEHIESAGDKEYHCDIHQGDDFIEEYTQ
jgi:viroplasmin and RNaseH domain-containing protein